MDTNYHNQSEFWCWLNEIFVILSSLTNSPLKKLPNVLNRESRRVTSHEWGRGRNRLAPYGKAMEENYVSHSSADIAATVGKLWGLTCVTFGCNNRTLQGVSLHKFPLKQNPILAKEWKKRAGSWKAAHLTALAKKKKKSRPTSRNTIEVKTESLFLMVTMMIRPTSHLSHQCYWYYSDINLFLVAIANFFDSAKIGGGRRSVSVAIA